MQNILKTLSETILFMVCEDWEPLAWDVAESDSNKVFQQKLDFIHFFLTQHTHTGFFFLVL